MQACFWSQAHSSPSAWTDSHIAISEANPEKLEAAAEVYKDLLSSVRLQFYWDCGRAR